MEHLILLEDLLAFIINEENPVQKRIDIFWKLQEKVDLTEVKTVHKIIYRIIEDIIRKASFIPGTREFEMLLYTNVDRFIFSKEIDINSIVSNEGFPLDLNNIRDIDLAKDSLYGATMQKFETLTNMKVSEGQAVAGLHALNDFFQKSKVAKALSDAHKIFFEGLTIGKKSLSGLDVVPFIMKEFTNINNTYNVQTMTSQTNILDKDYLMKLNTAGQAKKPRVLFDYSLDPINEAFGPFKTGTTLAVNGQEGVGKTRYAISRIVQCATKYKENVFFYCGEQDSETLTQMMVCHYAFNEGYYIEDSWVREDILSDEQSTIYENMKVNFLTNPNYGKIILVTGRMGVNEVLPQIDFTNKFVMPIGMAVVDHMGLLATEYQENKELQEAYQGLHSYGKMNNVGMVLLNHLNDDEVNRILEGKDARTTGGAKTRESTRTPDYILTLTQTQKQKEVSKVNFQSPKARLGKSFPGFLADVSFGVSDYRYEK